MTMLDDADELLRQLGVTVIGPTDFAGAVWSSDEPAYFQVYIQNSTAARFHNVKVRVDLTGPVKIEAPGGYGGGMLLFKSRELPGNELIPFVGQSYSPFKLVPEGAGGIGVSVSVTADVVPTATSENPVRSLHTIEPI